jgi:hypothetical protein
VTIIISIVSDHGLIQASDSNLTRSGSSVASPGPKVFPLGFTNGALALAGTYSVGTGTQTMETWMPSCISDYTSTNSPTQEGFANYLKERLNTDLTSSQKTFATMMSATTTACIQRCISCATLRLSTLQQVHTKA